jgi:hypothetical protein
LRDSVLCGVRTEGKEKVDTNNLRDRHLAVSEITVIAIVNLLLMCGEKRTVCVV